MSSTGFYWHERCFWHDQGAIGVFSAPGEFLQPQSASESPESKRRLKNILEVSGLIDELHVVKPPRCHAGRPAAFSYPAATWMNCRQGTKRRAATAATARLTCRAAGRPPLSPQG